LLTAAIAVPCRFVPEVRPHDVFVTHDYSLSAQFA
jgi:hypothetical protein